MDHDEGDEGPWGASGEGRVRAARGDNHDRIARIKGRYDPQNTFSVNQNNTPVSL